MRQATHRRYAPDMGKNVSNRGGDGVLPLVEQLHRSTGELEGGAFYAPRPRFMVESRPTSKNLHGVYSP